MGVSIISWQTLNDDQQLVTLLMLTRNYVTPIKPNVVTKAFLVICCGEQNFPCNLLTWSYVERLNFTF